MLILFTGQIASGKSTLSTDLAKALAWPRVSFGGYVAFCAERIGLNPADRETLQDLGLCLAKRPREFAKGFLEWSGDAPNMVIDGLRHLSMLEAVKESGTDDVALVFIETPDPVAEDRHKKRGRDSNDLARLRQHLVEREIEELKPLARWVIDGTAEDALQNVLRDLAAKQ